MNKKIRTAARAVILKDDKLLVLTRTGVQGEFYVLPGGGQNHGESIQDTLVREVWEEVSLQVEPEQLLFINEFIASRDSIFPEEERDVHQIDFTFSCRILGETEAEVGSTPDMYQTGIAWIPLSEVLDFTAHPKDDLNFIMGAPTRDLLVKWINNSGACHTPLLVP